MQITYKRIHPGDPDTVDWNGKTFTHGEPVDFDGRMTAHKAFIESARGNPWFDVEGDDADNGAGGGRPPKKRDVETPEQYRAYAIDWIARASNVRQLEGRWESEAQMREEIGWGSDDQAVIDPIYQPKLENLRRTED